MDEPYNPTLPAKRTFRADDLAVWVTPTPEAKIPLGPHHLRPNPCVFGDLVLCSLFNPGLIVALDRTTGERRWSLPLPYLGNDHLHPSAETGLVYGGTSQELFALEPETGRIVWRHCPYGRDRGEIFYSSPTAAGDRVFIGDVRGHLRCLSATTGARIWRVLTSRARNNDVNSTPVVDGGLVVVGTNARIVVAYETGSGHEAWREPVDGPCTDAVPAGPGRVLLWTGPSAYLLSVADGRPVGRWRRPGREVRHACAAGELVLLVTERTPTLKNPNASGSELRVLRRGIRICKLAYSPLCWSSVRYEMGTRKAYEATNYGLGIFDPDSCEREAAIEFSGADIRPWAREVHQPAVEGDRLYVMNGAGRVYCLRHP